MFVSGGKGITVKMDAGIKEVPYGRLVMKIVGRYAAGYARHTDDILGAGLLGLSVALSKIKYIREECRFSYVSTCINTAICDHLRKEKKKVEREGAPLEIVLMDATDYAPDVGGGVRFVGLTAPEETVLRLKRVGLTGVAVSKRMNCSYQYVSKLWLSIKGKAVQI